VVERRFLGELIGWKIAGREVMAMDNHVIVVGERHLRRILTAYVTYYHGARTHLALEKDAPTTRRVQTPTEGHVIAFSEVGGLHHRYERRAA
jgi:putative transposase